MKVNSEVLPELTLVAVLNLVTFVEGIELTNTNNIVDVFLISHPRGTTNRQPHHWFATLDNSNGKFNDCIKFINEMKHRYNYPSFRLHELRTMIQDKLEN